MKNQINYENAIANRGNLDRMKKLMKRAKKGETLTISFLGGSITQGSLATKPELCYAYHVYEWWCKTFQKSQFTYLNAGIGATDSQFGCARVEKDVLSKKPDFVIIEFSVNDESNEHFMETYEGLVRKVYDSPSKPAVLLVHNVCYHNGGNAQLIHAKTGRYYELPEVSMQSSIYPELVAGRMENRAITPDDLHPNDEGHALVASVINYFLDKTAREMDVPEEEAPKLKPAFTQNAYEDSVRYQNDNMAPVLKGFVADNEKQNGITDIFKNGWIASKLGDRIIFEVEGSCIGVQYRKTIQHPAPIAKLIIDDEKEVVLDANFTETWGDKLVLDTVAEHIEKGRHKVEIILAATHPDDQLPFYLVSVIASGK